ncbi:hypothetical protein [Actinomadura rubteroloni]|nr:hypothetical protein [Actinomadura rubteroloni]
MEKRNPGDVGRTMVAIIKEVANNVPREPVTRDPQPYFGFCDTGLDNRRKRVPPMPGDPWQVGFNVYDATAGLYYSVKSHEESMAVIGTLYYRLEGVGGWNLKKDSNVGEVDGKRYERESPTNFRGAKNGVDVSVSENPAGPAGAPGFVVSIRFDAGCYKHPRA